MIMDVQEDLMLMTSNVEWRDLAQFMMFLVAVLLVILGYVFYKKYGSL
jgi:Tfp pilus assembly protein PilO